MIATATAVGDHLRQWRQRRRLSQLDLALDAEISTRHLSFLETGRAPAQPRHGPATGRAPRDPAARAQHHPGGGRLRAGVPATGPRRSGPRLARRAVDIILTGHEPHPALAVDRGWNLVSANRMIAPLLSGVAPELLAGPMNVLRLTLHPNGLAPRVANLHEWRAHLLDRLRREVELTADPKLSELLTELRAYPIPGGQPPRKASDEYGGVAIPFRIQSPIGLLSFFSTTTVFGTPVDVTLSELTLETFFPADPQTAEALRGLAASLD